MIFEVTPEQIERLKDDDLRTLVGYLAEREVAVAGKSTSGVTHGGDQNAQDGGIDVRVDLGTCNISGYIPRPQTGFQVKAADMARGAIKKEMRPGGKLRPSIVRLGEDRGAYIIVSSKGSVADAALISRKKAMEDAVDESTASNLYLDFYDKHRLATWVNQHPGLIPWVRLRVGLPLSGWRPYGDWSSSPGAVTEEYFIDGHLRIRGAHLNDTGSLGITSGIQKLREALAQPKSSVRIVGLSGVGKTRLVQALFDRAIKGDALDPRLAVYTDLSDSPDPTPLELLEQLQNFCQRCVLIVDNCGAAIHRELCARMRNAVSDVSLVTVEYDVSDDEQENTETFRLEPASARIIRRIVERRYPDLAQPEVSTIVSFSEGNARIALALAQEAQRGDSVANLKDSDLIKRLFRQNHGDDPQLLRAARACALVYSFEGEELSGAEAELPRIAALAGESVEDMHFHVAELMRRQLVQKRSSWRAFLPHALAHRLAKEALQDFLAARVHQHLVQDAPERLLRSFSRRLGCLHDSPEAQALVAQWLGHGGLLEKVEALNNLGIQILENVAPVNPFSVLCVIEKTMNRDEIISNRLHLVRILRSLAYDPTLFDKAVSLIVRLAEGEPESNNVGTAANVFKSLFYLHLSGTHADAKQRADFLRSIADSPLEPRRTLVLSSLEAMLKYNNFSSSHGFEFGTRKRDYGYQPKTHDDVWDWYREALLLAGDLAERDHLRGSVRTKIASQFRLIAPALEVTDELVTLADRFAADGGWPEGWGGVRSAAAALKKNGRDAEAAKLAALACRLKPRTLEARIASYVLADQWSDVFGIAGIDFDPENYETARKKVEELRESIGKELAADLSSLGRNLPSMLRSSSGSVSTVAWTIGRETQEPRKAWDTILSAVLAPAHEGRLVEFPSAFLAGLSKTKRDLCEKLLDESLADPALHPFVAQMQASVGVDETATTRLVEALKHETVPVHKYRMLAGGRACDGLSASNLKALLLAIVAREGGLEIALDILSMRLLAKRTDGRPIEEDEKEAGRELLRAAILGKVNQGRAASILAELVRQCLRSPLEHRRIGWNR